MSNIERVTIYFTHEELQALERIVGNHNFSSKQSLIRQIMRDHLQIDFPVKEFHVDALCPNCGPNSQIVSYSDDKKLCLNCKYTDF